MRIDILRHRPSPVAGSDGAFFLGHAYCFDSDAATLVDDAVVRRLTPRGTHYAYHTNNANDNHAAFAACIAESLTDLLETLGAYIAEVALRAGMTDNVAASLLAFLRTHADAPSSGMVAIKRLYAFAEPDQARTLYNPLIETMETAALGQFQGFPDRIAKVAIAPPAAPIRINLAIDDEALRTLSKYGVVGAGDEGHRGPLGLGLDDMRALSAHYAHLARDITDVELETYAQTWSEHCKHRFFGARIEGIAGAHAYAEDIPEGIFRRYIYATTESIMAANPGFCHSVFHDNAGGIDFGDYVLAYKVETHNSPSALDPYGGAMTGVLGVNRDCLGFGLGARPIANTFGFALAPREDDRTLYRDKARRDAVLSPAALADGIIQGVEEAGNHSGIPTVQGFLYEAADYRAKPLVFCGTLGLIPKTIQGRPSTQKRAMEGDYIVMLGNAVGLDGIHGATFSSIELDEVSPNTAVQIGDPIGQKNLADALLAARGLYRTITDCGAGGLSSAIGEMAQNVGASPNGRADGGQDATKGGAVVWLDKVPLKYPNLAPWQVWISESQERMIVAVDSANLERLLAHFAHYEVAATAIGQFCTDGALRLYDNDVLVGELDMAFLHEGAPKRTYTATPFAADWPTPPYASIRALLADSNYQSRAHLFRRFDHEVGGITRRKPVCCDVAEDVVVLSPFETRHDGAKGLSVAMAQAMLPTLTECAPYMAGFLAVDLAVRRLMCGGAGLNKTAILDNFCWSQPEDGGRIYALAESARGLSDAALAYGSPIISGKDSMYNDFNGYDATGAVSLASTPSLLISAIGVVADPSHARPFGFQAAGNTVVLYAPKCGQDQDDTNYDTKDCIKRAGYAADYAKVQHWVRESRIHSMGAIGEGGVAFALVRAVLASGADNSAPLAGTFTAPRPFDLLEGAFILEVAADDNKVLNDPSITALGTVAEGAFSLNEEALSIAELNGLYHQGAYA